MLTLYTHWPYIRCIPRPVIQASHVPGYFLSVHLKKHISSCTAVTAVIKELHRVSIPVWYKVCSIRRLDNLVLSINSNCSNNLRRIDTLDPLALVQLVCWCPAFVPVTNHPPLIIQFSNLFWFKLSGNTARKPDYKVYSNMKHNYDILVYPRLVL